MSVRVGAETTRDRLARSALKYWALAAASVALLAGLGVRTTDGSGADRALLDLTLPLVVPIACVAVFECAYGGGKSGLLVEPLARHGADRRRSLLGSDAVVIAICAVLAAGSSSLSVLGANAVPARALADVYACLWGGALVGAAYGALFALGSTWGRAGRLWLFFGDWLLGSGSGAAALPWVRGHARSLLGGAPVLRTSSGLAAVSLVLLASLCVLASARRGPR